MEYVDALDEAFQASLPPSWLDPYRSALDAGNPHSKKFPLMNPFHAVLVSIVYLIIIFAGKSIMRSRKAFEVRLFSLIHNGSMVLLNAYMCYEIIRQALLNQFSLFGNGIDTSANGLALAKVLWLFYFSKPIEFIDTFIMVLKKNNHQISFLHLYHHVATFLIWWGVVYYAPGGDSYFSSAQNCFIHVLMYGYYFMATLKISCPWKNNLTQAQMLQFCMNAVQAIYVIYYPTSYPRLWAIVLLSYMVTLLVLFGNFYVQSNRKRAADKAKQKKSE